MTDRVVVCFFFPAFVESTPPVALERARRLTERARALGGRRIAWSASLVAFDFEPDAIEDAIDLAVFSTNRAHAGDRTVGVSVGPLTSTEETASESSLAWGQALVAAEALAEAAGPGEVLVDSALADLAKGTLATIGSRAVSLGTASLRGLVLDVNEPVRPTPKTGSFVLRPEFIGRPEIDELLVPAGSAAVLRAGRGFGGTRFFDEIEAKFAPARVLRVGPGAFGEPLGALRRSMFRAVALGHAPRGVVAEAGRSLDALLAVEGLDQHASAELLAAWLLPDSAKDPPNVLVLDDANEVDVDTLDAIAEASRISTRPFRICMRVGDLDRPPASLESLAVGAEVLLGSLSHEQAALLAARAAGAELDGPMASLFATRGSRLPLGVVESVRDSVESGELEALESRDAVLNSELPGHRSPKHWIARRIARLEPHPCRVLEAIAVLGGEAETVELFDVVRRRSDLGIDVASVVVALERTRLVERKKPDLIALPTASHREAVLAMDSDGQILAWHAAAADAILSKDRRLSVCRAAAHAMLAGDLSRAAHEAARAATAARAAGLVATSEAFREFAERRDADALVLRRLSRSDAGVAQASERPRASIPPSAVAAIRTGDVDAMERLADQLRADEGRVELADRLAAMAKLARGETGDAIRRLRLAADEAKEARSTDRCRASLALGVALAAANRHEEALLEALDALARAREGADKKGERACIRFLAQLSTTAGHPDIAAAWAALANA